MRYILMRLILLLLPVFAFSGMAWANSLEYKPLKLPKAAKVTAFSNGLPPVEGRRRYLTKGEIIRFLKAGTNNTEPDTWVTPFEERIKEDWCDGVFVDSAGRIYFWRLITPKVLRLETAEGESAQLHLPQTPGTAPTPDTPTLFGSSATRL